MAERAKHAHGSRKNLENAIAQGVVNEYDVLFLSGEDESNAIGWVNKNGEAVIIDPVAEVSKLEAELETELATKANAEEVAAELATKVSTEEVETVVINKVETVVNDKVTEVVNEKVSEDVVTIVDEAMDAKVTEAVNTAKEYAKEYTDAKIAEIEEAASYEIVEF